MKLTEKAFTEEANRILVNLTPMLETGVVYAIYLKEFAERLDLIESRIMALDTVSDETTKREVVAKARKHLIDYLTNHNKKAQNNH